MKDGRKRSGWPVLYGLTALIAVRAHELPEYEQALCGWLGVETEFPFLRALLGALCVCVLLLYAVRWVRRDIHRSQPVIGCAAAMFAVLIVMTLIYRGASGYWLDWAAGFALMLIFDMGLQRERDGTLNALSLALLLWVCANIPVRLLVPWGLNGPDPNPEFVPEWLIGNRAFYYRIAFPALGLELVRSQARSGRYTLRTAFVFAAVTATVALQRGGTGLMGYAVLLAMTVFFARRALPRYAQPIIMLAVSVLLFICLHYFKVQQRMGWLIEDVLEKDATLSFRTDAWTASLQIIGKNPVTGVGLLPVAYKKELLGYSHTHNQVLELLLHGGALALLPYIGMTWLASRETLRHRQSAAVKNAALLLMTFLFMGTVEMFHNDPLYYPLFVLAFRADCLAESERPLPCVSLFRRG